MKTVLAPGAPWPKWEAVSEQKKTTPRAKPKAKRKPRPALAVPSIVLDFFAEAREQIATGKAKCRPSDSRRTTKPN